MRIGRKSKAPKPGKTENPDLPGFTEVERHIQDAFAAFRLQHEGVYNVARDLLVIENGLRGEAEAILTDAAFRAARLDAAANQIAKMRSDISGEERLRLTNGSLNGAAENDK